MRANSIKWAISAVGAGLFLCPSHSFAAGLFLDVPGLSAGAQASLVAHYDGRTGVSTNGSAVDSWTPVDGDGNPLPGMVVTSAARSGGGGADLITYDPISGSLSFDDTAVGAEGRRLSGTLSNAQSANFTVMWLGLYEADAPFATSGTYAYNIGPSDISHQRDDGGGGFRVEMYNGTTYAGDDITAYDGIATVWSTVLTGSSHNVFANGTNLNVGGSPTNSVAANASIDMGAYSASGYDFVGDMSQMIIFDSALSDADRALVHNFLSTVPEPSVMLLLGLAMLPLLRIRRPR